MENLFDKRRFQYVSQPQTLYYLSGYENADARIILTEREKLYFTDSRYFEEVKESVKNFEILSLAEFENFSSDSVEKIGIEDGLSYSEYQKLKNRFPLANFYSVSEKFTKKRILKKSFELKYMQKAQEITDKAFVKILSEIKEGMTEKEVASVLEGLLFQNGGEGLAFSSIVAFGKNTSKPHAHRTDNRLKNGELITMDFGAKYRGYCSDMTRTVAFGKPSPEIINVYGKVLDAQNFAIEKLSVGMSGKEADALARDYFAKEKLDGYFLHSLGHGVGIDIHEPPYLSKSSADVLSDKMAFSVEPGLYFADNFGIRIEDVVYFNKTDIIDLTKAPKSLIIL